MIPFNKPYLTGNETAYIEDAVISGHISGNGKYTKKCQHFFKNKYSFQKCLLTSSCTDALEMAAILIDESLQDTPCMRRCFLASLEIKNAVSLHRLVS